ncbi:MAG: 50S ribosomal protein L21 [Oscillospiraceae bacterium]|jgi:large subunit ribosomal protein L21|nr:50S ribosomal protein L21 [Oscillospiraceae bacterium]
MYAIIEACGKQWKVKQGDVVFTEKLNVNEGLSVDFKVVAVSDGKKIEVGSPYVNSAKVSGKVLKNGKRKKITVFTYKPKKNEKRKLGHRQPYSKVEIDSISV